MDVSQNRKTAAPGRRQLPQGGARYFAEKFDDIMKELDLSNVQLARSIHVDSSLVSRLRNGVRMPSGDVTSLICKRLCERAHETGCVALLRDRIGMAGDEPLDTETFARRLHKYFMSFPSEADNQAIDGFIERVGAASPLSASSLQPVESIAGNDILDEKTTSYYGLDGMRRAVLRFVGEVIRSGRQETLLAHSDQGMEWLLGDRDYMIRCVSLILHALHRGSSIRIIHNLDRHLPEILNAINFWLPLYMTGQVDTYYHRRNTRSTFSHTLFVSEKAVVTSSLVCGTEDRGVYNYFEERDTAIYREQFNAMLAHSAPLMKLFMDRNSESLANLRNQNSRTRGRTNRLLTSPLPIETIPNELLASIACRLNTPDGDALVSCYTRRRRVFESMLECGGLTDFLCLPDKRGSGAVPLDTEGAQDDIKILCTEEEYALHLAATMALADSGESYRAVPLKELPFAGIQITAKCEAGVLLERVGESPLVLYFRHPAMSNSFFEYMNDLAEKVPAAVLLC